jgi:exopolysaccharide production protein ExoY
MQITARTARVPSRLGASDDSPQRAALGGLWKRVFDITIGSMAIIVLTPILLATAGLVRLLLGKPVIMAEERIGYEGRAFACYAFRTTAATTKEWRSLCEGSDGYWASVLGQALRTVALEKLPRLLNVLRGDMSLVGPRPITANELRKRGQAQEYFFARPGLTGLWRHVGRRVLCTPGGHSAIDRYYVRYWSMSLDLALLIKAISANRSDSDIG